MTAAVRVPTPRGLIEVEIEPLNSDALLQTPLPPKVWTTSGRCVLECNRGLRQLGLVFLTSGGVMASVGWLVGSTTGWPQPHSAMFLGLGLLVLPSVAIVMIAAQSQWVFDRAAGVYRRTSLSDAKEWPLDQIVTVQTTFGGNHQAAAAGTDSPADGLQVECFQLNLVLDTGGARGARKNLVNLPDRAFVVRAGQALADYLAVPWLDAIDAVRAVGSLPPRGTGGTLKGDVRRSG